MLKSSLLVLLFILAAQAQAQPTPLSGLGGGILVGLDTDPEPAIGYPVAEWSSLFRRGQGTIVALLGQDSVGLGVGHRFADFKVGDGRTLLFTIGPAYTIKWSSCPEAEEGEPASTCKRGLRSGKFALFATIRFVSEPKSESE